MDRTALGILPEFWRHFGAPTGSRFVPRVTPLQIELLGEPAKELEGLHAREQGLVVEDDESPDGEWQFSWKVEEHAVD
jgi:hypothetical protein